ncbi:hypothetical protein AVEN_71889-1 [Araneus ventricosus]|uniref:Uncharacterized protein n=1 Tax=Araneus ventricosus TaxID=182803 RepID=A0A4Y2DA07_ARAVE|nr:hypothetical protein AVEN_71889-1 [Araneus ventricosus]
MRSVLRLRAFSVHSFANTEKLHLVICSMYQKLGSFIHIEESRETKKCAYTCEQNGSRAIRRYYFHGKQTKDLGKGANPLRIIKHRFSITNAERRGSSEAAFEYVLVCMFDLASSKEIRGKRRTTLERVPSIANSFVFAEKPVHTGEPATRERLAGKCMADLSSELSHRGDTVSSRRRGCRISKQALVNPMAQKWWCGSLGPLPMTGRTPVKRGVYCISRS